MKLVAFPKKEAEAAREHRPFLKQPAVVGAIGCAIIALLISPHLRTIIPNYEVGQVATADLVVPVDITVEDVATTEKRRNQALEQVAPVFDYDPAEFTRLTRSLQEAFQYSRQTAGAANPDTLHDEIQTRFQVSLTPETLLALRDNGFPANIEDVFVETVHSHYNQPVAAARVLAARGRAREMIIRNVQSHEEERIPGKDVPSEEVQRRTVERAIQQSERLTPAQKKACLMLTAELLHPNLHLNSYETEERERAAVAQVEPVFYQLRRGRTVMRKGDEVTAERLAEVSAIRNAIAQRRGSISAVLALVVLLGTLFASIWFYLRSFYRGRRAPDEVFAITSLVVVFSAGIYKALALLAELIAGSTSIPYLQNSSNFQYAIPFPLGALLLTLLLDGHVAIVGSLFNALLVGLMSGGDFYLAFYSLLGSLAAIYGTTHYKERSAVYRTGLVISIGCTFFALLLQFLARTMAPPDALLFIVAMTLLSGVLVAALASFLLPLFESSFRFLTDVKLLELANLNLPILRQLMLEAPGTYHHSILIGTLAEAGAEAIGANPLFLRTAAYYHDIGKIKMAEYFIENQRGENPHDKLNPSMSALIIANHVKEGIEMAARIHLPKPIADCIPQHHGTRLMTYFHKKALERQDPTMNPVSEEDYRHQGPKPQSKEAAILMLADAVEASARTLEDPSVGRLKSVIKKMFDAIIADGQLDEAEVTLKELDKISQAFLRVLMGIYHRRISYPGFQFEEKKMRNGKA